jgi:imidazolonepropionase-like amidohydrolase
MPSFVRADAGVSSSCALVRVISIAIALTATVPALAQFPLQSTLIKEATVLVGDGTALAGASVVITGEKITAVGAGARGGMLTATIPATGKFITPGLIDAWSTLGLQSADLARSPLARAADAFDRYDRHEIDAALRQGVTMAFLPARSLSAAGGLGAIVHLSDSTDEVFIEVEAALCGGLGADWRQSALQRVRSAAEFRKQWLDAKQYRKSLEDYEQDLKEYEERVKKRAEENKDGKKDDKKDEKKDEKPDEKREEAPPPPSPTPRPDRPRPPRPRPGQPPRGERRPAQPETAPDAARRDEKKDDLKKPAEPQRDRGKETLLRGIDGKLTVRIEAHRPEDILNALDIAREFNLALVIEGGSGAHLVADRLVAANVPVVLSPAPPSMTFGDGPHRYDAPGLAAKLARAGVRVCFGSGPARADSAAARNLVLLAAQAAGAGMDSDQALRAITGGAAELLGIAGDYGTVAAGRYADLVVWSDHPFTPGARVERVFVRGKEVYREKAGEDAE